MTTTTILPEAPIEAPIDAARARDLVRYREGVEMLLHLQSDKPIANSEPAHAAILFELFFKYAKNHVRIFCKKLSRCVFDDAALVREAGWALKRGVRISVLYQDQAPEESPLLSLLRRCDMPVLRAAGPVATELPLNFAVMDDRAIRIELDREKCEAQARMHAPEVATLLRRRFDILALASAPPGTPQPAQA